MLKNFAPAPLGINGRQSELIELALTYGFNAMDVDMHEMVRRAQRTSTEDATKYLDAATNLSVGGFDIGVDLDADEDAFIKQLAELNPIADMAKQLGARCAYSRVPAATDRLPYHEYYEVQKGRLKDIAEILADTRHQVGDRIFFWQRVGRGQRVSLSFETCKASWRWSTMCLDPTLASCLILGIGLSVAVRWIS